MWSPMDSFSNWVMASPARLWRFIGAVLVLAAFGMGVEAWTFVDSRFGQRYEARSPFRDMPMDRDGRLWHAGEYAVVAVLMGGVGAYVFWVAPRGSRRARAASPE